MKPLITLLFALAVSAQAATVTLTWDPSPDATSTNHAPVTYTVVANGQMYDAGNATMLFITNLIGGVEYAFNVVAVDKDGVWSDPSNVVKYTPSEGTPPAPHATFMSITRLSDGRYRVTQTWNPLPSSFMVTNYLMVVSIGATSVTNQVGTNTTASIVVPQFNSANVGLQAQNNQAFSALTNTYVYTKPRGVNNPRVTQP